MKDKIKKLSPHEIKVLRSQFEPITFNNEFHLVYESHVPNTGIVLLGGGLALYKKNRIKLSVQPGSMLGIYHLFNNEPSDLACKVSDNSELILIQKSDIMDAMSDEDSELYAIIKETIIL
jgi:hypothetical protein